MVLTALQLSFLVTMYTLIVIAIMMVARRKKERIDTPLLWDMMWLIMEIIRCGRRLPRMVAELLLPPHKICPMVFWHLSLKEWRENAEDYFQRQIGVFGWLEERHLPPIPRTKYCYETRQWVEDMTPDDKAAYLKELRRQGA